MKMIENTLETPRLKLIPCTIELLQILLSNNENIAKFLNVNLADDWNEYGSSIFQYVLEKIGTQTENYIWWTYLVLLKEQNSLIGNGGYKGPPDSHGRVEIGYSIAPKYRKKGFATEFANALTQNALSKSLVKNVQAHTMAENNPSTSVLKRCGFEKIEETSIRKQEVIWRWEYIQ